MLSPFDIETLLNRGVAAASRLELEDKFALLSRFAPKFFRQNLPGKAEEIIYQISGWITQTGEMKPTAVAQQVFHGTLIEMLFECNMIKKCLVTCESHLNESLSVISLANIHLVTKIASIAQHVGDHVLLAKIESKLELALRNSANGSASCLAFMHLALKSKDYECADAMLHRIQGLGQRQGNLLLAILIAGLVGDVTLQGAEGDISNWLAAKVFPSPRLLAMIALWEARIGRTETAVMRLNSTRNLLQGLLESAEENSLKLECALGYAIANCGIDVGRLIDEWMEEHTQQKMTARDLRIVATCYSILGDLELTTKALERIKGEDWNTCVEDIVCNSIRANQIDLALNVLRRFAYSSKTTYRLIAKASLEITSKPESLPTNVREFDSIFHIWLNS